MKRFLLLFTAVTLSGIVSAQTPNFSQDIAPILYSHCTTCHRDGSIAPFPLQTYTDALDHGMDIKSDVNDRIMPPWPPNPDYNHMAHERILSAAEIQKINDWVSGGFPEGNPDLKPPLPVFPDGSALGTPDLQLQIPDYYINSNTDVFRCFVLPSGLSQDRYISALELLPGNRQVVHHVLVFWDTTGTCKQLDDADPLPGYEGFGGVGTSKAQLMGAWVPGQTPYPLPTGFGIPIPKNADIVMQFHYAPGSQYQTDDSKLNLFLLPVSATVRPVFNDAVLNHFTNINKPLIIPADSVKTFTEQFTVPLAVSIFGVAPHMHLIGKSIKSYAVTPAKDTLHLVDIPNWSFHWQGNYSFRKVMKIPAFTKLNAIATYDNTDNNEENPNTPPQQVIVGEGTKNEMMLVFFMWTFYQAGDENIIIDSASLTTGIENTPVLSNVAEITAYPNPATDNVVVEFNVPVSGSYSMDVMDITGRKVLSLFENKTLQPGYQGLMYSLGSLPSGTYFISINGKGMQATNKLVVVKN